MTTVMDSATVDVAKLQAIADQASAESETSEETSEESQPSQKAYERFPNAPRLFTQHDLGKMLDVSPATIANAGIAPEFVREGTDQMFWTSTEQWQQWAKERAERKAKKAAERAQKEAEDFAKVTEKIQARAKTDPAARAALLKALGVTAEDLAAIAE